MTTIRKVTFDGNLYEFHSWRSLAYYLTERADIEDFLTNVVDETNKIRVAGKELPAPFSDALKAAQSSLGALYAWLPYEEEIDAWDPTGPDYTQPKVDA